MSKIDAPFVQLKRSGQKALMPFVTAGDPNLAFTEKLLLTLDAAGCDLIELGIPYSDPIADGPVIQASYTRALNGGVKLNGVFEMLGRVTPRMSAPVVAMISYAIIYRMGLERFLETAIQAGVAGAIVPDLPAEESQPFSEQCRRRDFSLIQLVAPTTPLDRAIEIAHRSSGFLYYVSVTGITGERQELPPALLANISQLKQYTQLPVCVGFGISQPEHIERLKSVADGFIVGSALVKRIAAIQTGQSENGALAEIDCFVRTMLSAAKRPG
jgi:tryptophan synthase alpha chain